MESERKKLSLFIESASASLVMSKGGGGNGGGMHQGVQNNYVENKKSKLKITIFIEARYIEVYLFIKLYTV